jgi:hypothetical protein
VIVFDLACDEGHRFEAWFRSSETFASQLAAGELACPLCRSPRVAKAPMAPRLSRGSAVAAEPVGDPPAAKHGEDVVPALSRLRAVIEATCDDVGTRFAAEARRINYGEAAERGIYGEASKEEALALREDGIVCQVLPWWQRRND